MKLKLTCLLLVVGMMFVNGCEIPQPQEESVQTRELITARNYTKIVGMQWILESMTIDGSAVPLVGENPFVQFDTENKVTGFASVNRFFGGVQVNTLGEVTWPGPFGTTRMAGPEELMKQENAFIQSIPKTEQMSISGIRLYLYNNSRSVELVFYVPVE